MRRKWLWVIPFWIGQAAVPYVMCVPLRDGDWPSARMWLDTLSDWEYVGWVGGVIGLLTLGQALFLLPVRRPGLSQRGTPLWLSLTIAGLVLAAAVGAFALAMCDVAWMITRDGNLEAEDLFLWVLGLMLLSWGVATPLLIRFCRGREPETLLSRIAARLFLGTMVEALAIIPLNVMMRRRDTCHCAHGTLWALIICGAIGWFALGPAVFLPLLARRRKRWYAGRCAACSYDMSGCMSAERCPECGAGWKPPEPSPAS